MRIALDFDDTVTLDPLFWTEFVRLARLHGHSVTIVTIRHQGWDNSDILGFATDLGVAVVCTDGEQKSTRHTADVWIDDSPVMIPNYSQSHGLLIPGEEA